MFDPHTQNWQDVFGDGMTANEVVGTAVDEVECIGPFDLVGVVSAYLYGEYEDLLGLGMDDYDTRYDWNDFDAMAEQVLTEAAEGDR